MARLLQFITGTSKVGFATHFCLLWSFFKYNLNDY
jgi:hypothetical protein